MERVKAAEAAAAAAGNERGEDANGSGSAAEAQVADADGAMVSEEAGPAGETAAPEGARVVEEVAASEGARPVEEVFRAPEGAGADERASADGVEGEDMAVGDVEMEVVGSGCVSAESAVEAQHPASISLEEFCARFLLPPDVFEKLSEVGFDQNDPNAVEELEPEHWEALGFAEEERDRVLKGYGLYWSPSSPETRLAAFCVEFNIPPNVSQKLQAMKFDPDRCNTNLPFTDQDWASHNITTAEHTTIKRKYACYVDPTLPRTFLSLPSDHTLSTFCTKYKIPKQDALVAMGFSLDDVDGMATLSKDVWITVGISPLHRTIIVRAHKSFSDSLLSDA